MSGQIRQNKITRRWVIYAPERGKRPKDFQKKRKDRQDRPAHEDSCPFCPGNETMLPTIITERPNPETGEWQTRVVPNKYPALTREDSTERHQEDIYLAMPGYGEHEVIIESPKHNQDIATMPLEAVNTIIETYHQRYVELMGEHDNMMAILFRNHGPRAGTSLLHPHSQLVVTSVVPRYVRVREEEAQRYFDDTGRCVFCDILDYERREQLRVILENDSFLAFVPFAAEVPFEIWVMPKQHRADFGNIIGAEKNHLAHVLQTILSRLHEKLHDPDYNYVIHTAARYKAGEPHLHWYLQVRPRLTTRAGFEIGSGMSINPTLPEDNAAYLAGAQQ